MACAIEKRGAAQYMLRTLPARMRTKKPSRVADFCGVTIRAAQGIFWMALGFSAINSDGWVHVDAGVGSVDAGAAVGGSFRHDSVAAECDIVVPWFRAREDQIDIFSARPWRVRFVFGLVSIWFLWFPVGSKMRVGQETVLAFNADPNRHSRAQRPTTRSCGQYL